MPASPSFLPLPKPDSVCVNPGLCARQAATGPHHQLRQPGYLESSLPLVSLRLHSQSIGGSVGSPFEIYPNPSTPPQSGCHPFFPGIAMSSPLCLCHCDLLHCSSSLECPLLPQRLLAPIVLLVSTPECGLQVSGCSVHSCVS